MLSLLIFIINASTAFADVGPSLSCSASAYAQEQITSEIPLKAFHPQELVLLPIQKEISASWEIVDLHLKKDFVRYYSSWSLSPLESLAPSEKEIYDGFSKREKSEVALRLTRFPSSENRVKGLSIELTVQGGFKAIYLIRPGVDGHSFSYKSPVRMKDEPNKILGHIFLDCRLLTSPTER